MSAKTMTREEWLAERRKGVGGSDAAAILGISPFRTAVDVWLDKTGRKPPTEETEAMRIGTELEDFVARRYVEKSGHAVQRFNRMLKRGVLLGNLDRLVIPDGEKVASHMGEVRTDTLLECKTASRDWGDGVPLYYQTQVQHYMGLDERLEHADVAVLFLVRKRFETYRVERDDDAIRLMSERLTAWWNKYVLGDEMPPPANEEDCKALWSHSNPGKSVEATDEVGDAVSRYRELTETAEAAEAEMKTLRDEICAAMGDAEVLTSPLDGKPIVTWRSAKDRAKTDWEAVAKELGATPEQIDAHTTLVAGARRFMLKTEAKKGTR